MRHEVHEPHTITCLDCKAFVVEAGWDGYYYGEHTCMDIGCAKNVWRLDNEDDQATFERYMRTAETCDKFEAK